MHVFHSKSSHFFSGIKSILHISNVHNNRLVFATLLAVHFGSITNVDGIHWSYSLGNKKSKQYFSVTEYGNLFLLHS